MIRERETFLQFRLAPDVRCEIQFRGLVTQAAIIKLIRLLDLSTDAYPVDVSSTDGVAQDLYNRLWDAYMNETAIEWCDRIREEFPDLEKNRPGHVEE